MLNRFKNILEENNLFTGGYRILVAVSGGIDSMVLCHLLSKFDISYSIAHVNHKTRAGESDADAIFVKQYAQHHSITFYQTDLEYQKTDGNFHDFAHKKRYEYFNSLGYDLVLTAHHQDDNVETVLLNLFNGRSVNRIPLRSQGVIRPLLSFDESEISEYARLEGVNFVTDKSNFQENYLRNKIRLKIIPELAEILPDYKKRILGFANVNNKNLTLLEKLVSQQVKVKKKGNHFVIEKNDLKSQDASFVYHAIKAFGFNFSQAEDIFISLNKSGTIILSSAYELLIDRAELLVKEKQEHIPTNIEIDLKHLPITIDIKGTKISFTKESNWETVSNKEIHFVPLELLNDKITIRSKQEGDLFYPLGMKGSKQTVKKYLTNLKMNVFEKKEQLLVCSAQQVIWLVGLRGDERYACQSKHKEFLKMQLSF